MTSGHKTAIITSEVNSVGNFVDQQSEELLNKLEKRFRGYQSATEDVYKKVKAQAVKYEYLANTTESFLKTFEFHLEDNTEKNVFFKGFGGAATTAEVNELENALSVFGDIVYFFKRKRSFYGKYKKMRLKNLDQQATDVTVTLNNQKQMLAELEKDILAYNKNLIEFLEGHPVIKQSIANSKQAIQSATNKLKKV